MDMFTLNTPKQPKRTIDDEAERILKTLEALPVDSKEYETAVLRLENVCRARSFKNSPYVSGDVIVAAAVNILGILLVLNYEKCDVLASKAFSMIFKQRV